MNSKIIRKTCTLNSNRGAPLDYIYLSISIILENHKMVSSIKSDRRDYFLLYVRGAVLHPLGTSQVSQMARIAVTGTRVRFPRG